MVIQKPTELTRIRNPPSWGIPQAPICQLLNTIYLSCGKLGMVFMYDGVSNNTSRIIGNWFDRDGTCLLNWLPWSPELAPVKQVWAKVKERTYTRYPRHWIV